MTDQLGFLISPYVLNDEEYQSHIEQTQIFTRILVDVLKHECSEIDNDFISYIDIAAIMHDIGKIYIPESIIFKKGRLTENEYDIVKTHTTKGHQHFSEISQNADSPLYRIIKDVILYHHEHWDGNGYPLQKKGSEIPLAARIVALADVFEALISPRSYKSPFTFEKAKRIICESSGSHFDPMVVFAFLKQEAKFRELTLTFQAAFQENCCD